MWALEVRVACRQRECVELRAIRVIVLRKFTVQKIC